MRPPGLRGLTIATLILALLVAGWAVLLPPDPGEYLYRQLLNCYGTLWLATHPWQPLYKVDLPQGGSLLYKLQEGDRWFDAPEFYSAQVDWQTPEGKSYFFDVPNVYERHPDIEFRLRDDGRAVWAVIRDKGDPPRVCFVLDLVTGKLVTLVPEWATVDGGRRLNKKPLAAKE